MRYRQLILIFAWSASYGAWQPLFDGKTLNGWSVEGSRSSFSMREGALECDGTAHAPNWLRSDRIYQDFRIRFEYKPAQWAETALLLRAPRTARPQHAGLAIFLGHDFHNKNGTHVTGAVLGAFPPSQLPKVGYGQWRRLEVELAGQRLRVSVDGVQVQNRDLAATPVTAQRLPIGHIGFADMGHAWSVRNVEIEDLGGSSRVVNLLAQGTLHGWEKRGESGAWSLNDGVLEGAEGHSILYAPGEFADFEFSAAVRSHRRTNSGVFFRGLSNSGSRGFEVQIYSPPDAVYHTGSIYNHQRSTLQADLDERWFLLQVRVEGRQVRVWVDGEPVCETDNLPEEHAGPGRVGFQIHMDKTSVEFRDVWVRPL